MGTFWLNKTVSLGVDKIQIQAVWNATEIGLTRQENIGVLTKFIYASNLYWTELFTDSTSGKIHFRSYRNETYSEWKEVAFVV